MTRMIRFCLVVLALSAAYLGIFSAIKAVQGENVTAYFRFHKLDEKGNRKFNWFSLLSPLQVESQKLVTDTIKFTSKVVYPLAPKFNCIAPTDLCAEAKVAGQIAKAITDSVRNLQFKTWGNYDNTCLAVRKAVNPTLFSAPKPQVSGSLFGTASPEAKIYGWEQSLQIGHREPENMELAKTRLMRTNSLLQKNLSDKGIHFKVTKLTYDEIQCTTLKEVTEAINNPAVLDSMRFVKADVKILVSHIAVTPVTAPVLLPVWIAGLSWLLPLLGLIRLPKRPLRGRVIKPATPWNWNRIWDWLWLLLVIIVIIILYLFEVLELWLALILLILFLIVWLIDKFLRWLRLRPIDWSRWRHFWNRVWYWVCYPFRWIRLRYLLWRHGMDCTCEFWLALSIILNIILLILYLRK